MPSPFRAYLDALRQFPFAVLQQPQHYFRRPGRDFTRRRSLYLERVVWLNITLLKTTLSVELDQFFDWLDTGQRSMTKSALVQARQKLLPRFFRDFFQFSVAAFYHHFKATRWKGFLLWATDGSGFRVPNEPELGEAFGWHGNQHDLVPSARMLVCYDLLNHLVAALQFHKRSTSESVIAVRSIAEIPQDVLMVYDRGYASHIVPFLHHYFGSNCVVRLPLGFSKTVKAFLSVGKNQQIITEPLQIKAQQTLQNLGIEVPVQATITYWLIRITLPDGTPEVLLTTLIDKKRFHWPHFGEIYRQRWGIETCFFVIKSFFQLCNFSAYTPNNCWQDIYSHFILYNLQTALHHPLQKEIKALNLHRQHEYKPNRNVSAGLLKRFITKICLRPIAELKGYLSDYYRQILQTMEPERPGKNKERKRRLMRGNERHIHEKNYRRAF
jgi:Transposase DDE domain